MSLFVYPPVTLSISGNATETTQQSILTEMEEINAKLPAGLVPEAHDYIEIAYVASGNGAGEIETVIYKTGGGGGSTVATLTLAYNGDNKLTSVTRS